MYDDSWYSFVPESDSHRLDVTSQGTKHRRRESLLKQPNGAHQILDPSDQLMELYEETLEFKGPPKATVARRAKSYSDFYDAAIGLLRKEASGTRSEQYHDVLHDEGDEASHTFNSELYEDELLASSHDEFQLYRNQLDLSERHLDTLINDTTAALDLLTGLSGSFRLVEVQTTAFEAQCEDLLVEQKRIRDLADKVGVDLQYYAYLEPLTRRLNAPGSGRIFKSDDFLDMLMNLNTCIDFMDRHPTYRDSTIYKTRYSSLLERSLNLVQVAFTASLREVSDDVSRQLKLKDQNETAEYILLYGKYENILSNLGYQVERLLKSTEFAFGLDSEDQPPSPYVPQWHELYRQILESYVKSREAVSPLILKNLRRFAAMDPTPDIDFKSFVRRCVQYVFDICRNELKLAEKFFQGGPLCADYPRSSSITWNYSERLEESRMAHLTTLHNYLLPFLSGGDLERICDLTNWLETMYMVPGDGDMDDDQLREDRRSTAQTLLNKHLWPLSDSLFLKAAIELEHFKPSPEDLLVTNGLGQSKEVSTTLAISRAPSTEKVSEYDVHTPSVANAYPTVKTAVKLLVMYNDGVYERPRAGDVLYEIVHQTTESLQKAATIIKRNTTIMNAQLFLIKNLMLIENLFMTHEIPDSVRQSAEFDFSPIWDTIKELQERKQLFNPLAYITPLVKGQLLPAVVDHLLDARKELEKVLVQQITSFTKYWQSRLSVKDSKSRGSIAKTSAELDELLNNVFEDETTKAALWKMIRADDY